jgi:hypothetical protein
MAQPAVADVRVSCPACGGPIHPIAGRCKHCRTDLVAARGGATGAQGTMIHIGQLGKIAPSKAAAAPLVTPSGAARPGLPTGPAVAAASMGIAPRTQGRWGKRWPLLVGAIAAIAIVASVAVLLLGDSGKGKHKRRVLGPAPDRMQTDELPTDPWARGSGSAIDPTNGQMLPGAQVPDLNPSNDDPPPPPEPTDDEPGVQGGVLGGAVDDPGATRALGTPDQFLSAALDVTCKRLAACWGDANANALDTCAKGRTMLRTQRGAVSMLCPTVDRTAAEQCLQQLAVLPCPDQSATMDELASMAYGLDPCMRACER